MNGALSGRDPHTLAGAYALDAVDDADRLRFEEHLERCAECAQEVRGFTETAARLGHALALTPPPRMRERVLAQIGHVRQLPPVVALPVPEFPEASRASRARRARPSWRSGSVWWPKLTAGLTAVSMAAAVVLGVVAIRAQDLLDTTRQDNRQIAAVLAAPDARAVTDRTEAGGRARAVVSRSQDRLVFVSSGLSPLPESSTYQLWRIGPSGITSAGLLRPDASGGDPPPVVVEGIGETATMGVTVEPAGGSRQPTSTPLIMLTLPEA
ncbi:anti-sigma factor domain-containing protein [Planobispora siamensis]|uniref:Regulator of SigK n=1 Tax=Planobispora siamensis TaxID=936338 RepID=A0A8J3SJG5_9ACTN|nr:anti-sigma factor [Planobispora siamensis]GIH95528.1 hypothetical protein Psi01_61580 [Planobispora siamensis]